MERKKILSEEEAFQKIKHYCAYQERCHSEVKEKLYSFGLYKNQVEDLLVKLIEDNYLNEERFAILYAGGKFRMKQWGRKKIAYELGQKRVSAYCIKVALKEINEEEYLACLNKLAIEKWSILQGEQYYSRLAKVQSFLLQRGFEPALVQKELRGFKQ